MTHRPQASVQTWARRLATLVLADIIVTDAGLDPGTARLLAEAIVNSWCGSRWAIIFF
jgi:hypothetical protein